MYKIAVIGGRDTVMGFKALGLETYPAADGAEAGRILKQLTRENDDYAIIYIEENFANPEMSVNFLADHFSMHRTLISKAVKAQTGETFSDYLMKLRMARA